MSPAPQGNLEVEHYIGSCLISARIPSQNNSSQKNQQSNNIINAGNRHNHHYQNHYHVNKTKGNDNPTESRLRQQGFVNKVQQRSGTDLNHVGQGNRYSLPLPLPAECNGYPNNHFIQPPRHHHSGNSGSGWAGMPLISMTSGNTRRNKNKGPSPSVNHRTNNKTIPQVSFNKNKETDGGAECNSQTADCSRSPLTRLAIHTQGAPLIQANRYNNHNRNRGNYNRDPQLRLYRGGDLMVRRLDVAKDTTKSTVNGQTKETTAAGNNSSDSLSVASDESSGNSENSLPRIIKPRKRRKKDRKPPPTSTSSTTSPSSSTQSSSSSTSTVSSTQLPPEENQRPVEEKSSIVTLQPYMPLCFESYEIHTETPIDLPNETTFVQTRSETDKPLEDLTASVDEFPFGNLLDDEDDARSELSSCAPATLCQCRYCDPSGVIWDVDQRCYSPFLTPPSPTDKIHFNKSMPIFFESTNPVRTFSQQVSVPAAATTPSYTLNDFGTMLRRSWSDPSSDINMGITRLFSNDSSSSSERNASSENSSAQLQVSSEIVTSPNGHRDIEIKFYSSPSPPSSVSAWPKQDVDYDTRDRLFVAEE